MICSIGGSITQGAKASKPEKNYGGVLAQWWQKTFPKAKIELVNAGIGVTGSNYGALRAQRDLLARRPDFVVVEYSVNDGDAQPFAETLEGLIRQVLKELPTDGKLSPVGTLSPPLFSDLFEHTVLLEADALKPVRNQGWVFDAGGKYWKSDRPGSRIEFEIEGQAILLMDWHIRGPMGKIKVQVNHRPAEVRDAWFDQTCGGYRQTTELARGLTAGKHRVSFEILSEKNRQSSGYEYRVLGLGTAGVAGR